MSDVRTLVIKTGTVKRISKELDLYKSDKEKEEEKLKKMKEEKMDPYDVKYAEKILDETKAMIPDTEQRLKQAVRDLEAYMGECGSLRDEKEYSEAQRQISEAGAKLE